MNRINEPVIQSEIVTDFEAGMKFAEKIGYPVIVRPAYTLGGTGGGIAENKEELSEILKSGLQLSSIGQVLLEKSVKGWKEVEYEVMRDSYGNCRTASINIINAVGIEGGCNVQFALNPESFEYAVIEINPRVSRSSALASKATGYPIAKLAAKISLGYGLDEIKNAVTQKTYACFEPSLDYVVCKIPKWPFDKFFGADRALGTKMMATGEVMAIGSNFEQAFLKGIRSLEIGRYSLDFKKFRDLSMRELKERVVTPDDERIFALAEMLRRGYSRFLKYKP